MRHTDILRRLKMSQIIQIRNRLTAHKGQHRAAGAHSRTVQGDAHCFSKHSSECFRPAACPTAVSRCGGAHLVQVGQRVGVPAEALVDHSERVPRRHAPQLLQVHHVERTGGRDGEGGGAGRQGEASNQPGCIMLISSIANTISYRQSRASR